MAITYTGTDKSDTENNHLQLTLLDDLEIEFCIQDHGGYSFVNLDMDTAIQLSKELRRSIAKIKEVKRGR